MLNYLKHLFLDIIVERTFFNYQPLEKVKPKLCLGTAQFGMSYGVTNERGKISESEVSDILTCANVYCQLFRYCSGLWQCRAVIGRIFKRAILKLSASLLLNHRLFFIT